MQNPQRSVRPSNPDSFLVIKISKRAAFGLFIGLIALAATIVLSPSWLTAPKTDDVVAVAAESEQPAPIAGPKVNSTNSVPGQPSSDGAPATSPTAADSEATTPPPMPSPPPEPLPVQTVTRRIVTYYPAEPAASAAPADSAAPQDDMPAEQPPDSTISSTLPAPSRPSPPPAILPAIVNAAGSTSPFALYSNWFDGFHKLHPDVQFNYQSVGGKAGIKLLLDGTIDFGAVDAPLTDEQLAAFRVPILHVPSVIGAVVPVYNLPGVPDLRVTPRILDGIFTGKIVSWNDPLIATHNPSANLPALPIIVIHRSDGCSTTQIFTDYLSKVSGEWQHRVGEGTSVNWPVGLGAKGNEGILGLIKQSYGAISYMDFQFALENHVEFTGVQNRSGHFVRADLQALTAAAASSNIPDDFRAWITNAPGDDAYPISSFLWFVAPVPHRTDGTTRDIVAFLRWITGNNPQATAAKLGFAPLPKELAERLNEAVSRIH